MLGVVVDVAFVNIVLVECICYFGEFVQFFREICTKKSFNSPRHEVTPVDGLVEQLREDLLISHQ